MYVSAEPQAGNKRQGKFIYIAPFRHKRIQRALQRHANAFKCDSKKHSEDVKITLKRQ